MGAEDNLKNIIERQRELLAELEAERRSIEDSDLVKENAELKAQLDKLRADFEQISNSAAMLAGENANLKSALYAQIYNERVKIVNTTAQKLNVYFSTGVYGELNRLSALEYNVKARIDYIRGALAHYNFSLYDETYARLNELSYILDSRVAEVRAYAAQMSSAFSQEEFDELEALKSEQISDEQVREIAKKNNLERFVGLKVLNTVGVLLLIVGAITLARFAYVQLSAPLKGAMLFALGAIMLISGEILSRKKPNVFSLGISAGGVGILYAALATSYFILEILPMYPAIAVCVLITAVAFILSNRYNSQTIAVFALIGGYLPMYSFGADAAATYGSMVYFIVLNLLALLFSFRKKWRVLSFGGMYLNIIATFYICYSLLGSTDVLDMTLTIVYVFFAFLIYTAIPIISTYLTKAKFSKLDVGLLAINTFFSSLMMYWAFYSFSLLDYIGLLAVAFAVVYLSLGRVITKLFSGEERITSALFYLTGLAFVVLIVPLQFDRVWLSLGWLAEGVLLAAYGVIRNEKRLKLAGLIIGALCLGAFLLFDCTWVSHYLFVYKYSAITLGSLVILGAYMSKKIMAGQFERIYKHFALANVWVFAMYMILKELWDALYPSFRGQAVYNLDYLLGALAVVVTFALAYAYPRIKLLSGLGIKILSIVLYAIGIITLAAMNSTIAPVARLYFHAGTPSFGVTVIGTAVILVTGVMSVFALRDIMTMAVTGRKLGVEWYPLAISGYFVVILTQNLIAQYGLSFSSAAISIIYVLTALAWIIFGFARRYSFIRRFGLGLAILSVAKLFLIDLASLTEGYRIISYFALGITLIAISFVYQYFSKRLELRWGASADAEEGS